MISTAQTTLFRFLLVVYISLSAGKPVWAEIKGAFLIRSENGIEVTIFRSPEQKPEEGYLLIEGTATEWDSHPIAVQIKDKKSERIDYIIEWHGRPYVILAARNGTYSMSLPKPFKEYEGLRKPYREEVKVDSGRLDALLAESKNSAHK